MSRQFLVVGATLYLHLPPSLSSLSMQFNTREQDTGVLFVIYSTFKSPSTNFLTQMAQQMRSAQLSLSLCSHSYPISAIFLANTKYPTKAGAYCSLLKSNSCYEIEYSWESDEHFSVELMSTFTRFYVWWLELPLVEEGNLSLAH